MATDLAKRIQELLRDGEKHLVKFDDAASNYKDLAQLLEEMPRARGLEQLLHNDVRPLTSVVESR